MGQLERYGLYVLCLVIFLILGVAIWGGDPVASMPATALQDAAPQRLEEQGPPPATVDTFFAPAHDTKPGGDELLGVESAAGGTSAPQTPNDAGPSKPAPAAEPAPVTPSFKSYVVKQNDSLERIARRELGSVKHLDRLRELNPDIDPKRMRVGTLLRLPTVMAASTAAAEPQKPATASADSYKVKPGDSPWTISQAVFGTNAYAKEILELNGIRDPKRLQVGKVLKMPARR
jgi:nucleoid-associated protein YgaU